MESGARQMDSNRRKLILDCDPGTDDSVCIIMALTHPGLQLMAITSESGNLPAARTANNALKILEYMGRDDIPVAQGLSRPLAREYPSDPYSHGEDGLGNHFFPEPILRLSPVSAPQMIIDIVTANPGEVTLVCTSCLTNVAAAFLMRPDIIPMIREIYHLGGAYGITEYAFRNATGDNPMSEWNIYVDPEAAKLVYESPVKITSIGLDIAFNPHAVNIGEETLRKLRALNNRQSRYALEIVDYIDRNNSISDRNIFINGPIDTTAMCCFICPEIMTDIRKIHVAIDTGGQLTRGMTLWDRRDHFRWEHLPLIHTVFAIDSERYQQVFYEALGGTGA